MTPHQRDNGYSSRYRRPFNWRAYILLLAVVFGAVGAALTIGTGG